MYPHSHVFWYFISQFMIWSLTFLHTCIQVKALTTYLLRSWVITLPKFSSCSLVVMRKEGKELVIFQTWSKKKIFYWLYWRYFLQNRNNERGDNWYNCQLPIGGFVSGTHSDKATDCPLFVSRVRQARSLALFIVTTSSRPICRTNFKESERGSSFLWQNCKLEQLHLTKTGGRTGLWTLHEESGWCKHTILKFFEPSKFIIELEKFYAPQNIFQV